MNSKQFESTKTVDGTMFFQRIKTDQNQVKIRGNVTAIELRSDKNKKPFYSIYIVCDGEETPVKWNLFKIEKADGLNVGDKIVGHGIYYGPNKRMLKHLRRLV